MMMMMNASRAVVVVVVMVVGTAYMVTIIIMMMQCLAVFDVIAAIPVQTVERVVLTIVQKWISEKL
jgi:hypothetical protein